MQTYTLLPASIQNRVGYLGYQPTANWAYPTIPTDNQSPLPSYEAPSSWAVNPMSNPAGTNETASLAVPTAQTPPTPESVSFFKNPLTWVVGGVATLVLGGLAYLNLENIKDVLGIGGIEGKKARALSHFETLKTDYANATTLEKKQALVGKMLEVMTRHEKAIFKDLPKDGLISYVEELKVLEGKAVPFAEEALKKAVKAEGQSPVKKAVDETKKTLKNSEIVDLAIKIFAVPAAAAFGLGFLSVTGLGGVLLGAGTSFSTFAVTTAIPAASGVATGVAGNTGVQAIGAWLGTVASVGAFWKPSELRKLIQKGYANLPKLRP